MPPTKQTARKTTGRHLALASALNSPASKRRPRRRAAASSPSKPYVIPGITVLDLRPRPPTPLKPILKRHGAGASSSLSTAEPTSLVPSDSTLCADDPVPAPSDRDSGPSTREGERGDSERRRSLLETLDQPISVYKRFAKWLEGQTCVDVGVLLRAVERDGHHFLSLARATVTFDCVVRGDVPPPTQDDDPSLTEHARMLRVFAELLNTKLLEGNVSRELERAVLRDGEPLMRLALCCLELDRTLKGTDKIVGSS